MLKININTNNLFNIICRCLQILHNGNKYFNQQYLQVFANIIQFSKKPHLMDMLQGTNIIHHKKIKNE